MKSLSAPTKRHRPILALTTGLFAASSLAGPVLAQETEAPPEAGIADIVVTAQKREESLQKTPISIAAFTADDLIKNGINEISDLRSQVPSLQITPHPNSGVSTRIFMRGVGSLLPALAFVGERGGGAAVSSISLPASSRLSTIASLSI